MRPDEYPMTQSTHQGELIQGHQDPPLSLNDQNNQFGLKHSKGKKGSLAKFEDLAVDAAGSIINDNFSKFESTNNSLLKFQNHKMLKRY